MENKFINSLGNLKLKLKEKVEGCKLIGLFVGLGGGGTEKCPLSQAKFPPTIDIGRTQFSKLASEPLLSMRTADANCTLTSC